MTQPVLHEKIDVSIYSVAEEAGVSIVSVSRVFNDYPHVSQRMRNRVFKAARRIGYTPRLVSKPRVIAVLVGHLDEISSGDFKSRMALQLTLEASKKGFLVEFIPADRLELATKKLVEAIVEFGLTSEEAEVLDNLPPVPSIAINKPNPTEDWHGISTDHYEEGKLAALHLMEHGHRAVSLVLDEPQGWSAEQRQKGFEQVIHSTQGARMELGFAATESADEIAQRILNKGCTACAMLTDNIGHQLLSEIQNRHGKKIPQEFSVIALEHKNVSAYHSPPLTTIGQPLHDIASCIVVSFEALLNGEDVERMQTLHSELLVRESVAQAT